MRQTPGFAADATLHSHRNQYAGKASGQVETDVAPAQMYSLSAGQGPRYVWSSEGCPPGQRLVYTDPQVLPKYCEWNGRLFQCGLQVVPGHWDCQPAIRVLS